MKDWLKANWTMVAAGGLIVLVIGAVVLAKVFSVPLSEADVESLKGLQGSMVAESAKNGFSNSMAIVDLDHCQALVTPLKIQKP